MAALQTWLKRSSGRFPIGQALSEAPHLHRPRAPHLVGREHHRYRLTDEESEAERG